MFPFGSMKMNDDPKIKATSQTAQDAEALKRAMGGSLAYDAMQTTPGGAEYAEAMRRLEQGTDALSSGLLGFLTGRAVDGTVTAGSLPSLEPVTSPQALGQRVREAREALGMTQAAFADAAGVGRRFVSELENGKATLELGKVMAVCAAAGLDLLVRSR
jgi:y4mF family transcriptional regulator